MTIKYLDSKRVSGLESDRTTVPNSNRGTITTDGSYTVIQFNSDGTFTPTSAFNVEYLVVAGGGGGGGQFGGTSISGAGGGAGGHLSGTGHGVTTQSYSITVGDGGAGGQGSGGSGVNASNGSNSIFDTKTAIGGGAAASANYDTPGEVGGSGGGGISANSPSHLGGSGTAGQGNAGGNGVPPQAGNRGSAGGGGAGAAAANSTANTTGTAGGIGESNSITGSAVTRAGGGGGGAGGNSGGSAGAGGIGGGGAGGGNSSNGTAGTANSGGGGGGAGSSGATSYDGGAGGSGIVIIRFLTSGNTYETGTPTAAIPTDIQDNSIFVETDTARRYWFSPQTATTEAVYTYTTTQSTNDILSGTAQPYSSERVGVELVSTANDGKYIKVGKWNLKRVGTLASDAYMKVEDSAGVVKGTSTGIAASGISNSAYEDVTFTLPTAVSLANGDRVYIQYTGTDGSGNYLAFGEKHPSTTPTGFEYTIYNKRDSGGNNPSGAWTDDGLPTALVPVATFDSVPATVTLPATWTRELPTLPTVSDLILHLDANASSTITKDGSNFVATWGDGSSASNDVTASGTTKPLWVDNVQNGLPVIRFDGSDDRMTGLTSSYSQPNTLFMVCTTPDTDSEAMFDGDTSRNLFNRQGTNTYRMFAGTGATGGTANTAMQVFTCVYNTTSSSFNINGSSVFTGQNVGTSALDDIIIGSFDGGTGIADMDVCEVLFYNKALSSSEITDIESYLNSKWSVY